MDDASVAPTTPVARTLHAMGDRHGTARSAEIRSLGVSATAEAQLVRRGVLWRPAPGVLVATGAPRTFEQRALAAVLAPGRAVVSHGTAARLHGLAGFEDHDLIEVICRKGAWPRSPPGTIVRHTRGMTDADVTIVNRVPALTVAATLTLLAPWAGAAATARALDSALDQGHCPDRLRAVAQRWRRRGRPGPPTLLRLLDARALR